MKPQELDRIIDRLAAQVHRPKGKYADKDALYAELRQRLAPSEPHIGQSRRPSWTIFGRWSVAASLLLIVTLGIAGVAVYEWSLEPASDTHSVTAAPSATAPTEPMVFEQMPLADIAQQLSHFYGTRIEVASPELAQYRVTATFAADEPLEEVLGALCTAAKCHWQRIDGSYVIGQ